MSPEQPDKPMDFDAILRAIDKLPLGEKQRLLARRRVRIEEELASRGPHVSLRGIMQGVEISDEDIAEARREMWSGFHASTSTLETKKTDANTPHHP